MAKFASAKNECTHNVILGKLISLKHLRNYKSELVFCLKKKKTLKNLQKQQPQKLFFANVYVIGTTYFDECYLYHVITGRLL